MKTYIVNVYANGSIRWYNEKCKPHCEDGPAVECSDGYKEYWINGKLHREDGPAVENPDGTKEFWIDGVMLSEEEFNNRNKKEMTVKQIEDILGYSIKIVKG